MLEDSWTVRGLESNFGDSGDVSREWSLFVVVDGGHCVCVYVYGRWKGKIGDVYWEVYT